MSESQVTFVTADSDRNEAAFRRSASDLAGCEGHLMEFGRPTLNSAVMPAAAVEAPTVVSTPVPATATSTPVPTRAAPTATTTLVINVAPIPADIPEYDRGDWKHWVDSDGDCQDARQEVLVAESLEQVTFETDRGCRVETGQWYGAFTGVYTGDPGDLDIDQPGAAQERPPVGRVEMGR